MVYFRLSDNDNSVVNVDMIVKMNLDIDNLKLNLKTEEGDRVFSFSDQYDLLHDWNRLVVGLCATEDIIYGEAEPITYKESWMR